MVINDETTVYHVMSRTALDGFPLGDIEKDFMLDLIRRYSALYLVEILGICIMGNHFHTLVKTLPEYKFTDQDIKKRYVGFYGDDRIFTDGLIPSLRVKLSSLSEFVREIKVGFARYYNRRHNRRGYFWGDRFKSVIVDKGETLINCLAYIDLNPLRAGIVSRPEDYRWNSLGYHVQTNNRDNFLSTDFGLKEFNVKSKKERIRRYRKYVYEAGAVNKPEKGKTPEKYAPLSQVNSTGQAKVIGDKILEKERNRGFELSRSDRFRYRTRYFTDSGVIGSKEFVSKTYMRFKHHFNSINEKIPKPVKGLSGVYSLKRLSEVI
jgi:REP element-mobilizing transposase RayT